MALDHLLERVVMKSQVEFYLGLHAQLIGSDPFRTSTSGTVSLKRDLLTLRSRVQHEGLAFLTKSLPKLGRAFDQGLVSNRFNIPVGFRKSAKNASIPAFMQEYFNLVFDEDGFLRDVVPVEVIRHIRQVLYLAYKLELPYSKSEESTTIGTFIQTDAELEISSSPLASDLVSLAKIITRKVFNDFDHKDILPRHGPGAVATGEKLEHKWRFSRLYNSIHQVYPYYVYYVAGGAHELSDRLDWYKSLQRRESGTAKVVLVPKDSRGPRLISCEPLEYQWVQQGLGRKMANFLERVSTHTRNHVNFTRQEINGNIAKSSSATQRYATLDLKDASDRVSLELVRRIFIDTPNLLRALEACRSTETRLPDGSFITLNKFAPMGSAICFPVEAYLFWAVIVAAVVHALRLPLEKVERRIFVYGDDIIVPTHWSAISIQALESVGLLVNRSKSCTTGFFRESCGVDAFKGHVVTPVRIRKLWSHSPTDGSALAAYSATANSLAAAGYVSASQYIWQAIEETFGLSMPFGTPRSSFPCRLVATPEEAIFLNKKLGFPWRVNRSYQRIEFRLPGLSPKRLDSKLNGWPRLLRDFVTPPVGDPSVVVVPRSTRIKRGWKSVA